MQKPVFHRSAIADLKKTYLFHEFSTQELTDFLSTAEAQTLYAGDELYARGSRAERFYFIQYGSVRTELTGPYGQPVSGNMVGGGGILGIVAAVCREPRLASAHAVETTEIISFLMDEIEVFYQREPMLATKFHRALNQHLATSLRASIHELSRLRETHYLERHHLSAA